MELRTARRRNGLLDVSPTIKRLDVERGTIADQRAEILGIGQILPPPRTDAGSCCCARTSSKSVARGNFSDCQQSLEHGKADQCFEQFLFREINTGNLLGPSPRSNGFEILQPFFRNRTETTVKSLSSKRRTTFSPSATKMPCSRCSCGPPHRAVGLRIPASRRIRFS